MTLIADFKTKIGVTGTTNDQFYVDNYLKPAIDKASELSTNIKLTTVTLTTGVQTYDLTDEEVASPVVSASGIQDLIIDEDFSSYLYYKVDFYIQGLTTLYIVDPNNVHGGQMRFKYNEFFSKPTIGESPTETNAPSRLFPALVMYAQGLYKMDALNAGSDSTGIERKREDNLEVTYGNIQSQLSAIKEQLKMAEEMMKSGGSVSALNFFSYLAI